MFRRVTGAAGLAAAASTAALFGWLRPRRVTVSGPSMLPTLQPGDHLLVVRPGRTRVGALVVVRAPSGMEVVKRVAGRTRAGVRVLGDNSAASTDSRTWGPLERAAVLGRAVYRYGPAHRVGRL